MNWLAAPGRILVRGGGRVVTYDRAERPGDLVAAYGEMLRCTKGPRLGARVFRALGGRVDATHGDVDARERVYWEGFRRTA